MTQLRAVFNSVDGIGRINSCIGVAQVLQDSGYHVTFVMNEVWRGHFAKYGFSEILFPDRVEREDKDMRYL